MYIYLSSKSVCEIENIGLLPWRIFINAFVHMSKFCWTKKKTNPNPPPLTSIICRKKLTVRKFFGSIDFVARFPCCLAILLNAATDENSLSPCSSRPYHFIWPSLPALIRSPPLVYADTVISTGRPHVVVATLPDRETAPNNERVVAGSSNFPLRGVVRSTEWMLRARDGVRSCVTVWTIVGIMGQSDSQKFRFAFFSLYYSKAFCVLDILFLFTEVQ